MDEETKRWTARRKAAVVLEIIQGKATVAEVSRHRSGTNGRGTIYAFV